MDLFAGDRDTESSVPSISITKAVAGKTHEKSNGKWNKFMANGKSEPVANGKSGLALSTMRNTKALLVKRESVEEETQLSHQPLTTQISTESVDHRQLLETLLDIKYDIKKEVTTLNSKMTKLDSQIEMLIKTIGSSGLKGGGSSGGGSPGGSTNIQIESDVTETRSTSPDSNSSQKAPKRLNKLTKGSKVSPQVPTLTPSGESPVKSKSNSRRDSNISVACESGTSGMTLTTTLDMTEDEPTNTNTNSQRKNKISNLDML